MSNIYDKIERLKEYIKKEETFIIDYGENDDGSTAASMYMGTLCHEFRELLKELEDM